MASTYKVKIEDNNGNAYLPHSAADITAFDRTGTTLSATATTVQGALEETANNLGGLIFYESDGEKYVVGADSVPKKLGSGIQVYKSGIKQLTEDMVISSAEAFAAYKAGTTFRNLNTATTEFIVRHYHNLGLDNEQINTKVAVEGYLQSGGYSFRRSRGYASGTTTAQYYYQIRIPFGGMYGAAAKWCYDENYYDKGSSSSSYVDIYTRLANNYIEFRIRGDRSYTTTREALSSLQMSYVLYY